MMANMGNNMPKRHLLLFSASFNAGWRCLKTKLTMAEFELINAEMINSIRQLVIFAI